MPYKTIPISYEFLTQMAETIYPAFTNGKWAAVPYTKDIIDKVLADEGTLTDINRGEWHFGPRNPGVAAGLGTFLEYPTGKEQKLTDAQKIDYSINVLFDASRNGIDIKLSLEESRALVALSLSIGNGIFTQGGSFRGIPENCFSGMWARDRAGFVTISQRVNAYHEEERVERLSDNTLKISSCYEPTQINDMDAMDEDQAIISPDGEPLYKFYSEQHLKQGINENRETIFTLAPHHVELQVQPIFWNAVLAKSAKRLEKIDTLTDKDLFAFIPLLEDFNFRTQFISKLEKQDDHIKDLAKKLMGVCYRHNQATLVLITLAQLETMSSSDAGLYDLKRLEDPAIRAQFSEELSPTTLDLANKWLKICYQQNPKMLSEISSSLPGIGFRITYPLRLAGRAIYQTAVTHPWKTAAFIGGVILGALGAALTATGILAPLGLALGSAGVAIASPATAAAVGTFLGVLAVGLVKSVVTLGKSIAAYFKPEQTEIVSEVGQATIKSTTAMLIQDKKEAQNKTQDKTLVKNHSPHLTEEIGKGNGKDEVIDEDEEKKADKNTRKNPTTPTSPH